MTTLARDGTGLLPGVLALAPPERDALLGVDQLLAHVSYASQNAVAPGETRRNTGTRSGA